MEQEDLEQTKAKGKKMNDDPNAMWLCIETSDTRKEAVTHITALITHCDNGGKLPDFAKKLELCEFMSLLDTMNMLATMD